MCYTQAVASGFCSGGISTAHFLIYPPSIPHQSWFCPIFNFYSQPLINLAPWPRKEKAAWTRRLPVPLSSDANWNECYDAVWQCVCVCGSMQAELLTGSPVASVEEAQRAGQELLRRGCRSAIVTLGPQGCVVVKAQDAAPKHVPTTAVAAVDTTVSKTCALCTHQSVQFFISIGFFSCPWKAQKTVRSKHVLSWLLLD